MAYLSFIEDKELERIIGYILKTGELAIEKAEKKFNRNVIDPFSILFEMYSFEPRFEQWMIDEKKRQTQKTLSNEIGHFHPKVLGSISGLGFLPNGKGIDIVNHDRKIIAEIKNKHNSLTGVYRSALYAKLEKWVMDKGQIYKDYTAYLVEVIPIKCDRYDIEFTPSNSGLGAKCARNPLIRQIDGYSFYALATGIENALEQLFEVIPKVIKTLKPEYNLKGEEEVRAYFNEAFLKKTPKKNP